MNIFLLSHLMLKIFMLFIHLLLLNSFHFLILIMHLLNNFFIYLSMHHQPFQMRSYFHLLELLNWDIVWRSILSLILMLILISKILGSSSMTMWVIKRYILYFKLLLVLISILIKLSIPFNIILLASFLWELLHLMII